MSQDYPQGIFNFSNNFERSPLVNHQHQIRRAPSLVGIEEEESGGIPGYETAGMLSEMFNFPSGTTELFHQRPQQMTAAAGMWYGNRQGLGPLDDLKDQNHVVSTINADSAAAMQLFIMNPQPRSPSPSNPSLNLHGNYGGGGGGGGGGGVIPLSQFTWIGHHGGGGGSSGETQGLSLSLSSSLQNFEGTKGEELRLGDGGLLYYNQGVGSSSSQYPYKNLSNHHNQVHVGSGSSLGMVNVVRNSKYVKAAQELLEEFCSVGRGQFKKNKFGIHSINTNSDPVNGGGGGDGGSSSVAKDLTPLSAAGRIEHQKRKVKLLSMLDEVDRRYNHYCEQMQMVVNSFDLVLGFGAAVPYTLLAQKAMSRHFRCLKDAISAQLKHCCELLGEKDGAGNSGITKGETPRLKLLEQSLRQQRAFHQMGMMDQEAWRPQRGLPERSVNILRAWLFEHFLHPYPSDADKHLLARQTGLSRNQVSNWFINARVRLWKPMVEDMYQQEAKEEEEQEEGPKKYTDSIAQTPTPTASAMTAVMTAAAITQSSTTTTTPTGKRSVINASDNDPSLVTINTPYCFSENQAKNTTTTISTATTTEVVMPPVSQPLSTNPDTCRHGSMVTADYRTTTSDEHGGGVGSTVIRFGTTAGDVSLTLGLRHAGNLPPEKNSFSVRDCGTR